MKIKSILFSQNPPIDFDKTPYAELSKKHNVQVDFFKFFQIQGISLNQFQKNKINIPDYSSIIFTSKNAINSFFAILNEMKIKLSPEVRYFCINQSTALYLQKYIKYRKRKIFISDGTAKELVNILENNMEHPFLFPCSIDSCVNPLLSLMDKRNINYQKAEVFQIVMANLHHTKIENYDMLVFFSPYGILSLKSNFPNYQQGETIIAALGHQVLEVAGELGINIEIMAPTAEHPSIFTVIDDYLFKVNGKRK